MWPIKTSNDCQYGLELGLAKSYSITFTLNGKSVLLFRRTRKLASLTFEMYGVDMYLRVWKCELPGPEIQPWYLRHGIHRCLSITIR